MNPESESASPPSPTTDGAFYDPQLSVLLSRLASLGGLAVPAHRFGFVESSISGVPILDLPRLNRAQELWTFCVPQGVAALAILQKENLPALWVAHDQSEVLIVKGLLASGDTVVEDVGGGNQTKAAQDLASGDLLVLTIEEPKLEQGEKPVEDRTAFDWFRHAIVRRKGVFIEAAIGTVVTTLLGVSVGIFTMQVYDRVLPNQGFSTLTVLFVGVMIALILEFVLKYVKEYMVERACREIDVELNNVFFGKALSIRMDKRPASVGSFASEIRQYEMVRNFLTSTSLFVFAELPLSLLLIAIIGTIGGPVALVPLALIPIGILIGLAIRARISSLAQNQMVEENRRTGLLFDVIDGIESLKAVSAEWKVLRQWNQRTEAIETRETAIRMAVTTAMNLTMTLQKISHAIIVTVGAVLVVDGSLTMGGLIACVIVGSQTLTPLARLPGMLVQWEHARNALAVLNRVLEMPSDRNPGDRLLVPSSCQGSLHLRVVKFSYTSKVEVLDIPRFEVRPGERVAIMGAVGSGKSTLLKVLSGLYKPDEGSVMLDGVDVFTLAPEYVREHVGYLSQDVRLFAGTLRDNLSIGLAAPGDEQILKAAALTGLLPSIDRHPKGLGLEITEGGRGLSGGQRQLVGLTRMLIAKPRTILLDEPTASMDVGLEKTVMKHLFQEIPLDTTVVMVTHKLAVLNHVSRVVFMVGGKLKFDAPRNEAVKRLAQLYPDQIRRSEPPSVSGPSTGTA